jgi:hypothetical protein
MVGQVTRTCRNRQVILAEHRGRGKGEREKAEAEKWGNEGAARGFWLPLSGREDMTEKTEIVIVNWSRAHESEDADCCRYLVRSI